MVKFRREARPSTAWGYRREAAPGDEERRAAPRDKMAVQGFKGSRAIESEEAEYKGLVRGLLLGCALPSVMLCIFLWNTGVSTNIVSKDVGAPRVHPSVSLRSP